MWRLNPRSLIQLLETLLIYIYIYIYRERERERERGGGEIQFMKIFGKLLKVKVKNV